MFAQKIHLSCLNLKIPVRRYFSEIMHSQPPVKSLCFLQLFFLISPLFWSADSINIWSAQNNTSSLFPLVLKLIHSQPTVHLNLGKPNTTKVQLAQNWTGTAPQVSFRILGIRLGWGPGFDWFGFLGTCWRLERLEYWKRDFLETHVITFSCGPIFVYLRLCLRHIFESLFAERWGAQWIHWASLGWMAPKQ